MSHNKPNQTDEQFLVSITGIKIKMHGLAPLILALGIAAAMGVVVVVEIPLLLPYASAKLSSSDFPSSAGRPSGDAGASHAGAR